jgi:hypothetical protein
MVRFVKLTRSRGRNPLLRVNPKLVNSFGMADSTDHSGETFLGVGDRTFYVKESPEEVERLLVGSALEHLATSLEEEEC